MEGLVSLPASLQGQPEPLHEEILHSLEEAWQHFLCKCQEAAMSPTEERWLGLLAELRKPGGIQDAEIALKNIHTETEHLCPFARFEVSVPTHVQAAQIKPLVRLLEGAIAIERQCLRDLVGVVDLGRVARPTECSSLPFNEIALHKTSDLVWWSWRVARMHRKLGDSEAAARCLEIVLAEARKAALEHGGWLPLVYVVAEMNHDVMYARGMTREHMRPLKDTLDRAISAMDTSHGDAGVLQGQRAMLQTVLDLHGVLVSFSRGSSRALAYKCAESVLEHVEQQLYCSIEDGALPPRFLSDLLDATREDSISVSCVQQLRSLYSNEHRMLAEWCDMRGSICSYMRVLRNLKGLPEQVMGHATSLQSLVKVCNRKLSRMRKESLRIAGMLRSGCPGRWAMQQELHRLQRGAGLLSYHLESPSVSGLQTALRQVFGTEGEITKWREDSFEVFSKVCCGWCSKVEAEVKQFRHCSGCKSVSYCSSDCQRSHWHDHRKTCKSLQ